MPEQEETKRLLKELGDQIGQQVPSFQKHWEEVREQFEEPERETMSNEEHEETIYSEIERLLPEVFQICSDDKKRKDKRVMGVYMVALDEHTYNADILPKQRDDDPQMWEDTKGYADINGARYIVEIVGYSHGHPRYRSLGKVQDWPKDSPIEVASRVRCLCCP